MPTESPGRAGVRAAAAAGLAVVALVVSGCGSNGDDTSTAPSARVPAAEVPGVQTFPGLTRNHVQGTVAYAQTPPVGGDHAPIWQNCGFYSEPIVTEQGVHAMEHGAVWITYDPSQPADQVAELRKLARQSYVLVSPFPGVPSPVVASAWGTQLQLPSATDTKLAQFLARYREGPQTPEPGAPCTGAVGDPE